MAGFSDLVQFFKDVKVEAGRVQWPERRQTAVTTGVVLVFVLITGLYLSGIDFLISLLMEQLLK